MYLCNLNIFLCSLIMVAGMCHFVFSSFRGKKTPREKTPCEKTMFSHGVFFLVYSSFRVASFRGEKTKWHKPATIPNNPSYCYIIVYCISHWSCFLVLSLLDGYVTENKADPDEPYVGLLHQINTKCHYSIKVNSPIYSDTMF